ncbi:peptidoglycan-binding protein [Marinobacter sp. 71-i]|uniref:Peptidoglycan-binding protein n=1 Tax=Marinobacter iranensis TaxID=2962607 RepID=A0ABT5YA21_9GAMM|nr:peptidoglycan-binding protein [Marinobacter iranensis]MDF0750524.1 peptidoglycan-binding protein [Marinobacter iranensis]
MSHSRFTRMSGPLVVAVASFCAVAQAGPVETIYAAENALYGAGYNIGKADGWMDNTLRTAIREYQSSNDKLQATGRLDPQTLSALGIAVTDNGTVSDNVVPNREAAMAALGMDEQRIGSATARRPVAEAPEPEALSDPEPEPEPVQVSQEEAEVEMAVADSQVPPASEPATENQETGSPTEDEVIVVEAEEPAPDPVANEAAEPTPKPEPQQATTSEDAPVEIATFEEPAEEPEPAQVVSSSTQTTSEPSAGTKSSGGFFSSIFDFLFGWLI